MASDSLSNVCLQGTGAMPYANGCAPLMTLPVTDCRRPCSAWRLRNIWCVACAPVAACLFTGRLLTSDLGTVMVQRSQSPLPEEKSRDHAQSADVHASTAKAYVKVASNSVASARASPSLICVADII